MLFRQTRRHVQEQTVGKRQHEQEHVARTRLGQHAAALEPGVA